MNNTTQGALSLATAFLLSASILVTLSIGFRNTIVQNTLGE